MFAKNKVSQSMIDAVNSVLNEEKKELLLEPKKKEIDETGFHKAAHAARKSGQSHFEFQGKKYPVTVKSYKEAIEMDEAAEKVPTATGMKVYGSRYGNSMKARKDQLKSPVDDVKKGPTEKNINNKSSTGVQYHHSVKEDGDCVTEPQAKKIAKKEVSHHNITMHKGQKNTVKEGTFASKLLAMTEAKGPLAGAPEEFTDNNLGEEEMTDAQMKKREKIVMSMKKGMAGFKQRYGKNWKNVMYATATKQAMKEDSSDTWNGSYDFVISEQEVEIEEGDASYKKNPPRTKMADVVDRKKTVKDLLKPRQYFGTGKVKEEVELSEKNDSHTHAAHYENEKGEWSGMKLFTAKDDQDAIRQAHKNCEKGCRLSKVERHMTVKEEYFNEAEEVISTGKKETHSTDMLRGRVSGVAKTNSFKNFKSELKSGGGMEAPSDMEKGEDTKEKQKITTNPGPVDIKFDDKLGRPNPYTHFKDEKHITSEEVRGELKKMRDHQKKEHNKELSHFEKMEKDAFKKEEVEELDEDSALDQFLSQKGLNTVNLSRDKKISYAKSNEFMRWKQNHQMEAAEIPFEGPYTKNPKNVKDKSGAVHTPMSRAKDLARQAFKKLKKETMMGKISGGV